MPLTHRPMATQDAFRVGLVSLLLCLGAPGQELLTKGRFTQVSLIQLIATPERFNDKLVATYGFLTLGEYPALWLHSQDSDNLLIPNAIWLDPGAEMRRNREIEAKYVTVVGTFHAFQSGRPGYNNNAGMSGGLTDIRRCTVWSDPAHPLGHKYDGKDQRELKQR